MRSRQIGEKADDRSILHYPAPRLRARLARVLFPCCLVEHLVLVARDVGRLARRSQIEYRGDVRSWSRLAEVARQQPAYIFGERYAELGSPGMRAPLQLRVDRDLRSCIHDGDIMPSRCRAGKPGSGASRRSPD